MCSQGTSEKSHTRAKCEKYLAIKRGWLLLDRLVLQYYTQKVCHLKQDLMTDGISESRELGGAERNVSQADVREDKQ